VALANERQPKSNEVEVSSVHFNIKERESESFLKAITGRLNEKSQIQRLKIGGLK